MSESLCCALYTIGSIVLSPPRPSIDFSSRQLLLYNDVTYWHIRGCERTDGSSSQPSRFFFLLPILPTGWSGLSHKLARPLLLTFPRIFRGFQVRDGSSTCLLFLKYPSCDILRGEKWRPIIRTRFAFPPPSLSLSLPPIAFTLFESTTHGDSINAMNKMNVRHIPWRLAQTLRDRILCLTV